MLSQGDFAAFLMSNEKDRSDLLERITGTEIYSDISIAAHRRLKKEKDELFLLEQQQQNFDLLTLPQKKALEEEEKELSEASLALQKEKTTFEKQLQWFEKETDLEIRLQSLQQEAEKLKKHQSSITPLQTTYDRHLKAKTLEKDLTVFKLQKEDLRQDQTTFQSLEGQLNELRLQLEEEAKELDQLGAQTATNKKQADDFEPVMEQVLLLDADLQNQEKEEHRLQEEANAQQDSLERIRKETDQIELQLKKWQQELEELKAWIDQNSFLDQFEKDQPLIQRISGEKAAIQKEIKENTQLLDRYQERLTELKKQEKELSTTLQRSQEGLKEQSEKWQQLLPEDWQPQQNSDALLASQQEVIRQKEQQLEAVRRFESYQEKSRQLMRELSQIWEQKVELDLKESCMQADLLGALTQLDLVEENLEYKHAIYLQQQTLANYEKHRHELKEGEPCPLCLSTTHPFREQKIKPYVDQARKDWEMAKAQAQITRREFREFASFEQQLYLDLQDLEQTKKAKLDTLHEFEKELASIQKVLGQEEWDRVHVQAPLKRMEELETELSHLQQWITDFQQIEKDRRQLQDQQREWQTQFAQIQQSIGEGAERIEEKQQQLKTLSKRAHILENEWKELALRYPGMTDANILSFDKKAKLFRQKDQQLKEIIRQMERKQETLLHQSKQLQKEKERASELNQSLQEKKTAINSIRQQRNQLFPGGDPREHRTGLLHQFQKTENQRQDLARKIDLQKGQEVSLSKEKDNIQVRIKKKTEKLEVLEQKTHQQLSKKGFSSLQDAEEALLAEQEAEHLLQQIQAWEQQLQENRLKQKETETEFKAHQKKKPKKVNTDFLGEQLALLEQKQQEQQRRIGAIQMELKQNELREEKAGALIEQISDQRKEVHRWTQLDDLIGSADGKKFRIFAQGLTLQRLVALANQHLGQLNGRYFIKKKEENDLELAIIDTFQANNERSMSTLSGGESFLVSLALALGLSDLAGRQSNIRSLFIDEGFGTLDESTLDIALTTLENLQSKGKTIGIISHVKELKERISTQIQVVKGANGFSSLQLIPQV
jgi:exonuclease SbcC